MGILMVMKLGGREALTQAMIIVQVSVSNSSIMKSYQLMLIKI